MRPPVTSIHDKSVTVTILVVVALMRALQIARVRKCQSVKESRAIRLTSARRTSVDLLCCRRDRAGDVGVDLRLGAEAELDVRHDAGATTAEDRAQAFGVDRCRQWLAKISSPRLKI